MGTRGPEQGVSATSPEAASPSAQHEEDRGGDHLETEVKYSVDARAAMPSLDGLTPISTVDPPVLQDLVAHYFDTDDFRLARLGITLRRRTGGEDAGWHLKVPRGAARHEVHEQAGIDRAPPRPLLDALDGVLRGRALSSPVTIRTTREVRRLRDARGSVLAEMADDRVRAEWHSEGSATTWREWEVELVSGGPAVLRRVSRRFEAAGAEPAAHGSKLARAMQDLGVSVNPSAAEHDSEADGVPEHAREVVRARLREQVTHLLCWDVLVRRDVQDSVHQMRVTVRRLRSALATFRPMYDRRRTDPLRTELKFLGLLLGDARDAEVLRDRIEHLADGEEPLPSDQGAIASAHLELIRRYRESHHRLVQNLRSPRYHALLDELEHLVTDTPWAPDHRDRRAGSLRKCVRHDWRRFAAAVDQAEAATDVEVRQRRLHEARKAAKRVRYAAEPLVPLFGDEAENFVTAVTEVQEALGDLNDALVSMRELPRLAAATSAGDLGPLKLEELRAHEQDAADDCEARFEKAWRHARRKKVLRWLG